MAFLVLVRRGKVCFYVVHRRIEQSDKRPVYAGLVIESERHRECSVSVRFRDVFQFRGHGLFRTRINDASAGGDLVRCTVHRRNEIEVKIDIGKRRDQV